MLVLLQTGLRVGVAQPYNHLPWVMRILSRQVVEVLPEVGVLLVALHPGMAWATEVMVVRLSLKLLPPAPMPACAPRPRVALPEGVGAQHKRVEIIIQVLPQDSTLEDQLVAVTAPGVAAAASTAEAAEVTVKDPEVGEAASSQTCSTRPGKTVLQSTLVHTQMCSTLSLAPPRPTMMRMPPRHQMA